MSTKSGRKITAGFLFVWHIWALTSTALAGPFAGGTGQVDDPYQIATAEQLLSIKSDPTLLDQHFVLIADIDLSPDRPEGRVFDEAPIGHTEEDAFRGFFDGDGHLVRNMTIQAPDTHAVGLFGWIENATIRNVGLEDCLVEAEAAVGGLVGESHESTVMTSYAQGTVSGEMNVGGLIGRSYNGIIRSCYVLGSVIGGNRVGGLLGYGYQSTVITCYCRCDVTSDDYFFGGLIGSGYEHTTYLSYWDTEAGGLTTSYGGRGQSSQDMMSMETYRGWGADAEWTLDEGVDTPRLAWQNQPGQLIVEPSNTYGGGTGQPEDPYQIWTAEQMLSIGYAAADFPSAFALMADIDFAEIDPDETVPIGTLGLPFTGIFDGRGHTISHLCLPLAESNYVGLFGYVGSADDDPTRPGGEVKNLHLEAVEVWGDRHVAALVGLNKGRVTSCSASGVATGTYLIGGLVGGNNGGVITSSYADSQVQGGTRLGSLAGDNTGRIVSCYAAGSVNGEMRVGGLVGCNFEGAVVTCYATAHVSGDTLVGGLVGDDDEGAVYLSYWDTETSGLETSGDGRGRTTAQLQMPETFRGWGTEQQWILAAGEDTPRLVWEGRPGELLQDDPAPYTLGTGDPNDPYQIWTAADLTAIAWHLSDWDKCFVLMADIDVNGVDARQIQPIGFMGYPFTGSFEGQGHTISHFTCQFDGTDYVGLFGAVGADPSISDGLIGEIRNLRLTDLEVTGRGRVGGLVGYNEGCILACRVEGTVHGTSDCVGALVGYNNAGSVISCLTNCIVSGDDYIGGLIGSNREGSVLTSAAWGDVRGNEDAGGLAGSNSGTITQCYATGDVSYGEGVGGLVSYNGGTITECYAVGHVTGDEEETGGLVSGYHSYNVFRSFWDTETSGCIESAGGIGLTTEALQTAQTYLDAGWDFVNTWTITEGVDYPRLQWE